MGQVQRALVLTLLLGGCGGSPPSTSPAPTPVPTAPSPPPAATPAPSPLPPPPVLATVESISVQSSTVPSGEATQATVTIAGPATATTLVFLRSSDASVAVPQSVTIAEGQSRAVFPVQTQLVIFDTAVTLQASSGASERSTMLRVVAPPTVASGMFLRFISYPGDYVGGGRSLRFEPSSTVKFTGIVWTGMSGSSFQQQLILSVAELTPVYRDWQLILWSPRGQRLVPGVYRNATHLPDIRDGTTALSFSGDGRGCDKSTGEFEIIEAQYGPRPPNGERIERLVARFRQMCSGTTTWLSGELSVSNVPTF